MALWVNQLSKTLFWDVEMTVVEPEKNARFIIERVLARGSWNDWLLIKAHYDKAALVSLLPTLRNTPKEKNFLAVYTQT
jgi:hypothetical protein